MSGGPPKKLGLRKPGQRAAVAELEAGAEARASKIPGQAPEQRSETIRYGTKKRPYIRKDGTHTKTTSVTLPVEDLEWVRRRAFIADIKMSEVFRLGIEALRKSEE